MQEMQKAATLTDIGVRKLGSGLEIVIIEMAIGDGNGESIEPTPASTSLVNEFGRQPVQEGSTSESWLNVIAYINSRFACNTIREFGLYDQDGDMIVYSSYPATLVPPSIDATQYIQIEIECYLEFHNASAVTIEVMPIYPQATELERGIAKIANHEAVKRGTCDKTMITPKKASHAYLTKVCAEEIYAQKNHIHDSKWVLITKRDGTFMMPAIGKWAAVIRAHVVDESGFDLELGVYRVAVKRLSNLQKSPSSIFQRLKYKSDELQYLDFNDRVMKNIEFEILMYQEGFLESQHVDYTVEIFKYRD